MDSGSDGDGAAPSGLTVCPWPNDKRWAYSISFDEALAELHQFAIPILEAHGVPGHVEAVVGHLGQRRQIGQSSYNGYRHMSGAELRDLLERGWGVGNHSWSHGTLDAANVEQEIGEARRTLEDAVADAITIYCAPGNNHNMNPIVLDACRRHGYLGAMGIFDALNRPGDDDLLWLKRSFLHDQGPCGHESEFDPFRKLQHARRDRGWIIDYCHCPLQTPVHPRKDCSAAQLRERIETVLAEGGDDVWLARIEHAVDYRYTCRHLRWQRQAPDRYVVDCTAAPASVRRRMVTLRLQAPAAAVEVDGRPIARTDRERPVLFDLDLNAPRTLRIIEAGDSRP